MAYENVTKLKLDCCGMQCPGPIMEVFKSVRDMKDGELLEVSASDPGFAKDIVSWCKRTGNTLISNEERDGAYVAVMSPAEGDASAQLVTDAANWQHPSWARDMRHVVADRDRALFVIDTVEGGDKPRQVFAANGNWISPSWVK